MFDEAAAEGSCFTLERRKIPVIGRAALLKHKRAVGRVPREEWSPIP